MGQHMPPPHICGVNDVKKDKEGDKLSRDHLPPPKAPHVNHEGHSLVLLHGFGQVLAGDVVLEDQGGGEYETKKKEE